MTENHTAPGPISVHLRLTRGNAADQVFLNGMDITDAVQKVTLDADAGRRPIGRRVRPEITLVLAPHEITVAADIARENVNVHVSNTLDVASEDLARRVVDLLRKYERRTN